MTNLEKAYDELTELTERVRALTYNVFQHNPIYTDNDKKSLIKLGLEARSIGNSFETLGVNLINIHEERQKDEVS